MANYPISGTRAQIAYGWETQFNSAGTVNKSFSQGVKVPTYDIDNDPEYLYAIGSQDMQYGFAKTFKGTWGVEFIYSDPWWLKAILGSAPADGGAAPFTHTWTVANGGIANAMTSMTMIYGFDNDTDSEHTLTGCICNSATLTAAVGEPIRVRLEGWYSGTAKDTSLASKVDPVEAPMTFAQASLELPNATTISDIQSVELTWNRNNDPVYAIGSRFPQQNVPKNREWNLRVTSTYEKDTDFLDSVLGSSTAPTANPAEVASCELTITNGGSGSAQRSLVALFGATFLSRASIPSSPEDLVKIDVEGRSRSITSVIVSNNTQNAV